MTDFLHPRSSAPSTSLRAWFVRVLTLFLLAACAPTPTPTPTPIQPMRAPQPTAAPSPTRARIELQLWHALGTADQNTLDALAQKFNATHPEIFITATNAGSYSDLLKRVPLASTFNPPPDLALLQPADIAAQLKTDAFIPLDDLLNDADIGLRTPDYADISPAFLDRYPQHGNRVYSLAFARQMQVMYYNADLLKSGGIAKPPETWDDFTKTCAAIAKPPDVFCWLTDINAFDFAAQVYARGGELVSADGKTVAFNGKTALDALNLLKDHLTKGYAVPSKIAFQEPRDFAKGKLAFAFDTAAGLLLYERTLKSADKPINWGIALYPRANANTNRVALVYGEAFAIFKSSPEKARAAFAFVKWLMDAPQSAEWAKATGALPARESSRNLLADYFAAHPAYASAFDQLKFARAEPNVAAWSSIRVMLADAISAALSGKITPADALKEAERKANSVLAEK
ncbi:MAG: ABC transporter substrate-binding protein [Chloroflexi bacterium]|nr:ABC transporter substrate-binding protein [Chloroflexota bacterium]